MTTQIIWCAGKPYEVQPLNDPDDWKQHPLYKEPEEKTKNDDKLHEIEEF